MKCKLKASNIEHHNVIVKNGFKKGHLNFESLSTKCVPASLLYNSS